ncbi:unnamed protein product, partial [Ectocarpus fasciculatus]
KFHVTDLVEKEGGVHRVVDDNLDTDYGNENYHALDNTVHIMPSSGIVSAASGGDSGKGKRGGIRGLVSQKMSGLGKSTSLARSSSNNDLGGAHQRRSKTGLD